MGDGGLASSVAGGVSNYYGDGKNSSVGENTVQHSYSSSGKPKKDNSKIKVTKQKGR